MTFEDLIEGFGDKVGIAGVCADADGVVRVGIDGFTVAFMGVPETDRLRMWCDLGEMPPDEYGDVAARMLRENFARRGREVLSCDETGHAFAHRDVPLDGLDFMGFVEGPLEEFLGLLSGWSEVSSCGGSDIMAWQSV